MRLPINLIYVVILSLSGSALADDDSTVYSVRDIDANSDKFRKVINTVAEQLYERQLKQLTMHDVEILQSIGDQTYRVFVGSDSYVLKIPGAKIYPDGEIISLPVLKTEEVFQYTSVLGALTTISVLTIADIPTRLSSAEVVARLKSGEEFPIVMGNKVIKCRKCHGLGSIGGVNSKTCRSCDGSRREKVANIFVVVW